MAAWLAVLALGAEAFMTIGCWPPRGRRPGRRLLRNASMSGLGSHTPQWPQTADLQGRKSCESQEVRVTAVSLVAGSHRKKEVSCLGGEGSCIFPCSRPLVVTN